MNTDSIGLQQENPARDICSVTTFHVHSSQSEVPCSMGKAADALQKLLEYVEAENFAGFDPYDALSSPILRSVSLGSKWGRIAWIQVLRRLPVNVRPLLLIPKGHNPKALGLFLEGYIRLYRINPEPETLNNIRHLIDLLDGLKTRTRSGHGWGYNFDWQSRAFFVPKFTPTIVNSAFIGHALLDMADEGLDARGLDLVMPVGEFILQDLHRSVEGDSFCFSYTPVDQYAVHNANLLGASLLIRLWKHSGEERYREAALAALAYSMRHQHDDGSWYYSEKEGSRWIDSFHTGFNLEAVRRFIRLDQGQEWRAGYERGRDYYRDAFFLNDGTPKYYHNKTYPIDIHAPAQAIAYFAEEDGEFAEVADRVLGWTLGHMVDPKGFFYFRKSANYTNRIPYMRWGQAWAFRALTAWAFNRGRVG